MLHDERRVGDQNELSRGTCWARGYEEVGAGRKLRIESHDVVPTAMLAGVAGRVRPGTDDGKPREVQAREPVPGFLFAPFERQRVEPKSVKAEIDL